MISMYKDYFGLREHPFSIAPDPRYLYMSEGHREALAHLLYGIGEGGGFILLTGEVGTGKTTVCRCLLEQVPADTDVAFILHPPLTIEELLASICDELEIRYPEDSCGVKGFVDLINKYLLNAHAKGRKTVLILEEAQNLSVELLEQVRLLTNLETNSRKLLQIIMLGQPELRTVLSRPEMRQLSQRITARYHLAALSKKEVESYVSHRLAVAGVEESGLFSQDALHRLYRLSGGIPRLINLICDRALLGAYCEGKKTVDKRTIVRASQEIVGLQHSRGRSGTFAVALSLLLLAGGAGVAAFFHTPQAARTESVKNIQQLKPDISESLEWPVDQPIERSSEMAFRALFELWGVHYAEGDACRAVKARGLACFDGAATVETLIQTNSPAVLKLFDPEGRSFFVLLRELKGRTATVMMGTRVKKVDIKKVEKSWLGDYTILWKVPAGYRGEINPGAKGPAVKWLDEQLARLQGRSPLGGGNPSYGADLVSQVKKFQLSRGLVPDGIVGPQTIIELTDEAAGGPRLKEAEGERNVLHSGRPEES